MGSKQISKKETAASKAIIELSRRHGILSRETSFIVVETRPDSQRTTGDTLLRKIPVTLTKGWHGGVFGLASSTTAVNTPLCPVHARGRVSGSHRFHMVPCQMADTVISDTPRVRRRSRLSKRHEDPVLAVLALQRAEGGFELDEAVAQMLGIPYAMLRKSAAKIRGRGRFDGWVLLSTGIVLSALDKKFGAERGTWYALTDKSRRWYESEAGRVKPSVWRAIGLPEAEYMCGCTLHVRGVP